LAQIPLHVFVLILMNRFSNRIYVAYNTFFILGLLCSMQIPFVGFQPVKTSEHMASAGQSKSLCHQWLTQSREN
jgi:dolichyl-diphosphooligosaccharide---protein glycosyltransferase